MGKLVKLIVFSLFLLFGNFLAFANSSEPNDSSTLIKRKAYRDSLAIVSSNKTYELKTLDDSLIILKKKLSDLKPEESKQPSLTKEDLVTKLILLASNYSYVPYDSVAINRVALNAFNATKGTELYNKHKIRLELLENYKDDIREFSALIKKTHSELKSGNSELRRRGAGKRALDQFKLLNSYNRYQRYSYWKETYLGKIMVAIEKIFNNPADNDWNGKLTKIKAELDEMINENQ